MAWNTPKTNWSATNRCTPEEYNRIVNNIKHIRDMAASIITPLTLENMGVKTFSSVPLFAELNAIENNLELINQNTYELEIGEKKTFAPNKPSPNNEWFNRIESITQRLYNRLSAQTQNNTAPTVEITSNVNDWTVYKPYILTGTVAANGEDIDKVILYYTSEGRSYEEELTVENGEFTKILSLDVGINNFKIRATDVNNNPSIVTFDKKYDAIAPAINVTSATGLIFGSEYTLTGKVTDAQSGVASVTIDEEAVTLGADGTFSKTFEVTGEKTYTIVATDNVGNTSTKNVTVFYDTAGHSVPLGTNGLITNVDKSHTHSHANGTNWYEDLNEESTRYLAVSETRGTYTGLGLEATATATYSCTVHIDILPNYQYIKRVVVGRYGYGAATINIAEGQTSFRVTDYDRSHGENSYFPAGPGERSRWGVKAYAGIKSVTYYYV